MAACKCSYRVNQHGLLNLRHLCLHGGRTLASLQGNPASQMQLWAPQSPGKVGKEVFPSHLGTGGGKGMTFTGRDINQNPVRTLLGDRDCVQKVGSTCSVKGLQELEG